MKLISEDVVTREVAERLLRQFHVSTSLEHEPTRSSRVRTLLENYNSLPAEYYVFGVLDSDSTICESQILQELIRSTKNSNFNVRLAYDEAESWLLADTNGISGYLGCDMSLIPTPSHSQARYPQNKEIRTLVKSSLFILKTLVPNSNSRRIKHEFERGRLMSKTNEYNEIMSDFIRNHWDITRASLNSYSLKKAVKSLERDLAAGIVR